MPEAKNQNHCRLGQWPREKGHKHASPTNEAPRCLWGFSGQGTAQGDPPTPAAPEGRDLETPNSGSVCFSGRQPDCSRSLSNETVRIIFSTKCKEDVCIGLSFSLLLLVFATGVLFPLGCSNVSLLAALAQRPSGTPWWEVWLVCLSNV